MKPIRRACALARALTRRRPLGAGGVITADAVLRLKRPIAVVVLLKQRKIPGLREARDSDGHHFTAKGHAIIASSLLPRVMGLFGGK